MGDAAPVPWIAAIVASTVPPGPVGVVVELCGVGVPATKSAALSPVLVCVALRATEVALEGAGVGPVPANPVAAPNATRSTTAGSAAQVPPHASAPAELTSATLPAVPPIEIVPTTSPATAGAAVLAPWASATSRYPPAAIVLPVSAVVAQVAPFAEAYWTDHALTSTGDAPGL